VSWASAGLVLYLIMVVEMVVDEVHAVHAPFRHGNHTNSSSVRPHLKNHSNIPTKRGKWLVCPSGLAWESVKKEHSIRVWGY
jgi:hypothetical protein